MIERGFELEVAAKKIIYDGGLQPNFFLNYNERTLMESAEFAERYVREIRSVKPSDARSQLDPIFELAVDSYNPFRALVGFGILGILKRDCPVPLTEVESSALDLIKDTSVGVAIRIVQQWYEEVKNRVSNPRTGNVFPGFNP